MTSLVTLKRGSSSTKSIPVAEKKGLYIRTFGCQMNEYDSEKLATLLSDDYTLVPSPQEAHLVLINTCSIRDKPEQKLYSLLGEIKSLKDLNSDVMIGVGGCVAQQEGHAILKRSKAVDLVFGTHNLSLVPSLVALRQSGAPPQVAIDYRDEWEDLPLGFVGNKVSVFVSISRGCNKNCSYCIVPTTRGKEVSRAPEEIEREVRIALHRGAREIVLLGQTVNSYGRDLARKEGKRKISFVDLINRLSELPQLERIRFTSPHPQEIREDFIQCVTQNPKVCRHIHMPVQSGNDRILGLMNRNYRRERYLAIIRALKSAIPSMSITTDIIVGFPGETDGEFRETLSLMEEVRFDASYSFIFSPRPGTPAESMNDSVPREEKLSRLKELQALQFTHTTESLQSWVGKDVEVLIEGPSTNNPEELSGRSSQNIVVNLSESKDLVDTFVTTTKSVDRQFRSREYPFSSRGSSNSQGFFKSREALIGSTVSVRIDGASRFTLRGTIHSS
jgi:tRNA-2-methylthio-N6-dimethylallyladenosine synthase